MDRMITVIELVDVTLSLEEVHTWEVRLYNSSTYRYAHGYGYGRISANAEVGIIDYGEINADFAKSQKSGFITILQSMVKTA